MRIAECVLTAVALLGLGFPAAGQVESGRGLIRGTVLNGLGRPVAGAKVRVRRMDGGPMAAPVRFIETGGDGSFAMDRLEFGLYRVYAMKEAEGYPDASVAYYANGLNTSFDLSSNSPVVSVVVVIGPKGAMITGSIVDAVTGAPVRTAGVYMTRTSTPEYFESVNLHPEFEVLLPPDIGVVFEVTAPGYEKWEYEPAPLLLKSGEKVTVVVKLHPKLKEDGVIKPD